jgi:RimJ/RimL family protein N-acetyltransferase
MLADDIMHWQEESFGPWVFFEATARVFVGRGGLRRSTVAGRACAEVLFAVRSDAWGQGHATEIALTSIAHARRLGLAEVVGLTLMANVASRRVLQNAGLRFQRVQMHAAQPHWLGRLVLAGAG